MAAIEDIKVELEERLKELRSQGKLLEAQRLEARTNYDIEMLQRWGTAPGWKITPGISSGGHREAHPGLCWIIFPMTSCCSSMNHI